MWKHLRRKHPLEAAAITEKSDKINLHQNSIEETEERRRQKDTVATALLAICCAADCRPLSIAESPFFQRFCSYISNGRYTGMFTFCFLPSVLILLLVGRCCGEHSDVIGCERVHFSADPQNQTTPQFHSFRLNHN
jgi:hypothetical protein